MLLRPGDQGPEVRELNAILGILHYFDPDPKIGLVFLLYPPASDSDFFGDETADAVIHFKRFVTWGTIPVKGRYALNLSSPLVDDQTWAALQEAMQEWTLPTVISTAKRERRGKWVVPVLVVGVVLLGTKSQS